MSSPLPKKLRKEALNLIRLADKVISYRMDLMPEEAVEDIRRQREELEQMLGSKDQPPRQETVEKAMGRLDKIMKKHGGDIYPVTFINENVEMLLVAAILAIGIRTFFLQPFKIPTNSMYPTYAGMTEKVYSIDGPGPNAIEKLWHTIRLGATHIDEQSPTDGEVIVPVNIGSDELGPRAIVPFEVFEGRKWFGILPAVKWRYRLWIEGQYVAIEVPIDFHLDDVIRQTYFPEYETLYDAYAAAKAKGQIIRNGGGGQAIATGKQVKKGQNVIDFDIDTGDMLFVDRFSYNFVRPKVGSPIVFRTQKIPGLNDKAGNPAEQYYIKRLVGVPGDTLEVKESTLYRNDAPIAGADAFDKNAQEIDGYAGYKPMWRLRPGQTDTVPDGYVYAMGDNSPESYDSRGWGFNKPGENLNYVPETEVIGRAFFIFYPFTSRWGPAE
ncbi:signal peptidase I [Rubellicoccus peritrichatus]|uniref:Signal peptidase I n=1 Tax=Rubellicoccus peritrichatus TaxID=3080537 RepID=A0AAQ3QQ87_9BACT|nr:signal peptidase I [Puniceicoccus sp. CR14]WOO39983.1 signal peptidase I [Puniceicoccus sp. CR14]